ncbi:anti-sigma factor domain-containing protein [Neorhodopirellula lusitana]|uniref:anti-sigma factor domain-containing protein n=1 Tax=Neorhodopirellula lusitana TaxID=445327 RepID=UPI00384CB955
MNPSSNTPSEWEELLAGEALGDLDASELQRLDSEFGNERPQSSDELMQSVAALHLALTGTDGESLPDHLRRKITSDAAGYLPARNSINANTHIDSPKVELPSAHQANAGSKLAMRESLAWLTAAACLLLAIGSWLASSGGSTSDPGGNRVAMNVVEARKALQATPDRLEVQWGPGTTPFDAPVSGDVIWSTDQQKGFMRFVDMPINDPAVQQYQLWIIDPARDDEPIDGGVFNVTEAGEVIVPIDAKLKVIDPAAFAITIEKPGGVVVSTQERLPLLAAVEK